MTPFLEYLVIPKARLLAVSEACMIQPCSHPISLSGSKFLLTFTAADALSETALKISCVVIPNLGTNDREFNYRVKHSL
jgi:hypothetical protein